MNDLKEQRGQVVFYGKEINTQDVCNSNLQRVLVDFSNQNTQIVGYHDMEHSDHTDYDDYD